MKTTSSDYIFHKTNNIGQLCFNFGTFFLATALPISGIFFLFSILISFLETKFHFLNDKWNLIIIFIGGFFIFNAIRLNLFNFNSSIYLDKGISTLDLFNWIPLFVLFISSQYYLQNERQRYLFSKFLISGTIPVLISCILQHQFSIYGPFKIFFDLVIFFNKELLPGEGVSGLFSNQNYTGIWLTLSLPTLLIIIFKIKQFNYKKLILFLILLFLIYIIFLTTSRNAIAGLLSTLFLIFGIKKFLFLVVFIFLIYLSIGALESFIDLKSFNFISEAQKLSIVNKLKISSLANLLELIRVRIWLNTWKLIMQKPLFGFGASTFPIIYFNLTNLEFQHSHNMPLQLAFDYGLPLSIALTSFVTFLFLRSFINIFQLKNNDDFLSNKCWLASCLVAILNHMSDITYYDGKISILIWIFLAGLKCINDEMNQKKINS